MKKYLVVGNPVDHSLSPQLHNYWIKKNNIDAIYDKKQLNEEIFNISVPVLGICYGAQLISKMLGGRVEKSKIREFGPSKLKKLSQSKILKNFSSNETSWMSHGDTIVRLPKSLKVLARSEFGSISVFSSKLIFFI